jgi:DnaA-homolog protein
MIVQLPLEIKLRDSATFNNYFPGTNREVVEYLQLRSGVRDEPCVYLWGGAGTGKTHLLQAACHTVASRDLPTAYVPLSQADELSPEMLDGLAELSLVCIDDIHRVAGDEAWESVLFHLYNRMRDAGTHLVIAGRDAPGSLQIRLADLASRLAWGALFQIHPLNDEEKLQALQLHASARGMEMSLDVARFLLNRSRRDMPALYAMLDQLDHVSMSAQRRLTIPFIREFMSGRL